MTQDYLGMRTKEPEDKVDYGIKGMRWGVHRTDTQILKSVLQRKAKGEEITPTKKVEAATSSTSPTTKRPEGPETPQDRYARLQAQAKAGKAKDMDEADLKFFNARTEALNKVAKMNEQKPGWLTETTKKVLRNTAEQQLQAVATTVASKYISDRIAQSLKPPKK